MTAEVRVVPILATRSDCIGMRSAHARRPRGTEGFTPQVTQALSLFIPSLRAAYGIRLAQVTVFGSRARGDAGPDSDVDVAVLLDDVHVNTYKEKLIMADIAYDAIVATGIYIQPWPVSVRHWNDPMGHSNPALIEAMRRDGRPVELRS